MAGRVFARWRLVQWNLAIVLVTAALVPARLLANDGADDSSLLAFLSARGSERFNADRPGGRPEHGEALADALYTYSRGTLRVLAEGDASTDDAQLDRLQLGWEPVPDTLVWLGKFHEPASSWNFGHDHGHYLQTAISTPSIERWTDDAGVLPEYITGLLFDSRHRMGAEAAVQVSLAVGTAPNPVPRTGDSYWVRTITAGEHRVGWSARLAMLPDYAGTSSFGLLAARYRLDATGLDTVGRFDARTINQGVYGFYADGDWSQWSLHATAYYVDLSLQATSKPRTESFIAGYAQLERRFADRYTVYVRHENAARAPESTYLRAVQSHFAVRRNLAGARWDFTRHQALTLEIQRTTALTNRFTRIGLQWSAVIP
jgi:hypothetical protein